MKAMDFVFRRDFEKGASVLRTRMGTDVIFSKNTHGNKRRVFNHEKVLE